MFGQPGLHVCVATAVLCVAVQDHEGQPRSLGYLGHQMQVEAIARENLHCLVIWFRGSRC